MSVTHVTRIWTWHNFNIATYFQGGGTFFKVGGGGHSGGMSQNIFGGAQSVCRGSVATEGQGRRSIFRIGGGAKVRKMYLKNLLQNLQYNTLRA